ncbi:hypothetical protein LPTSP2_39110 [Leptospira ellinghausenii]|uniref:Uncharacterized protein n=1 Tax=Leptospira ellinghausenii TaxID=1917822 RepID=A0A2P2DIY9_9LEPT|nr:hypothetical protein [Leptospira ellinghausenii]GBF44608.1 hypothetical protein LPTSP2_39110 [Leptospira ellinghausenii]
MKNTNYIKQISNALKTLKKETLKKQKASLESFPLWNDLDYKDVEFATNEIINLLETGVESNSFVNLAFTTVSNLANQINNLASLYSTLESTPSLQNYHNYIANLDNFRTFCRNYGIYSEIQLTPILPETKNSINIELGKLIQANNEVQSLKDDIKQLISPTIAGKLSKSYADRKKFIFFGRLFALILITVSLYFGLYYTNNLIKDILTSTKIESINNDTNEISDKTETIKNNITLTYIILRSLALIPIYSLIIFLINQYIKERNIEEDYAHKEAVSSTLKILGELISDPEKKDSVLLSASQIIYKKPIESKESKNKDITFSIKEIKDLLK